MFAQFLDSPFTLYAVFSILPNQSTWRFVPEQWKKIKTENILKNTNSKYENVELIVHT